MAGQLASAFFPILAATFASAAPPAAAGPERLPPKPVLIAKGKGFAVHALKGVAAGMTAPPGIRLMTGPTVESGVGLLYTSLDSGEMKYLAATQSWVGQSPPMAIDRKYFGYDRILGLAADAERLYVARWSLTDEVRFPGGTAKPASEGMFRLHVFWLADGSSVGTYDLPKDQLPKAAPPETTDKGPLKLLEGGVSCAGATFRFKEKALVK